MSRPAKKAIHVELTAQEMAALEERVAAGEATDISALARHILDARRGDLQGVRVLTFWVDADQYYTLRNAAFDAGFYFKTYVRQMFTNFFREVD